MSARKPLGVTAERVAAVLERDPSAEFGWRWRWRPLSMFDDERVWATWNARFAGKAVGKVNHSKQVMFSLDGGQYDLRRIEEEFGEAVDAITGSSPGLPDDENTGGNAGDSGRLAEVIRVASRRSGLRLSDLTVLSVKRDPYRVDTPQGHRDGRWFAEWLDRLFPESGAPVHLRGFHYALISTEGVTKPDGKPYRNTDKDFTWLIDDAAKAARWLCYIDFERIIDQRNDHPVEYRHGPEPATTPPMGSVGSALFEGDWALHVTGEIDVEPPVIAAYSVGGAASMSSIACKPYAYLNGLEADAQPYSFAFFGEKSSLREVLEPIAREYEANMYLCSGEISDTLIYHMARDAAADGRPLVCFTFSDFDPAGHQMPISIGRKLQALRDFQFPNLRAEVAPVSLTLEQVIAERLPTTPVKSKEKRGRKWNEAFGPAMREAGLVTGSQPAQVEIDALAVIRPDVLRRITREKIALYRDETVERRAREVATRWYRVATPMVNAQVDDDSLGALKQRAEEAVEDFNTARDALVEAVDEAREVLLGRFEEARQVFVDSVEEPKEALDDAHDRLQEIESDLRDLLAHIRVPEPPEQLRPQIDLDAQSPIVRLDWSFEDATMALKSHKAYEGGDDEDEEEDDDAESSP